MKKAVVGTEKDEIVDKFVEILGIDRDELQDDIVNVKNDYLRLALEGNCDSKKVMNNMDLLDVLIKILYRD